MHEKWKILNTLNEAHLCESMNCLQDVARLDTITPEPEKLYQMLPAYDAYFSTLKIKLNEKLLARCNSLKVIATPSTGTDHLPMNYLNSRRVKVISLRQYPDLLKQITSTAELTWGLLLALIRHIPWGFRSVKAGQWQRNKFTGHQLSGKTCGIIGYGRLGKIVANYALAFGMRVIVYDLEQATTLPHGIIQVGLNELLSQADVITLHIHLNEQNRGFIGAAEMDKMHKHTVIINSSRGAIIDESALLQRLASGRLAGAAVDVIDGEWGDINIHPMVEYARKHKNLLITPHIGGVSYEAQQLAVKHTALQLRKFVKRTSSIQLSN
ncbi:MAG: D-isomer specific 2-hydroxyacid dehydrogenase family protein [Victivallaceae bacterium]|nr:D-isomer specific 2-hydroxyacid dehydrogenase family protein [Victivallaceae bacterium]